MKQFAAGAITGTVLGSGATVVLLVWAATRSESTEAFIKDLISEKVYKLMYGEPSRVVSPYNRNLAPKSYVRPRSSRG